MKRRTFVGALAGATVLGANDRLRVGVIGTGGRGSWLLQHEDFGAVQVAAICDVWKERMAAVAKAVPGGEKWSQYQDYRALLDKEKLDAVFVETTTHARALIAIHAMQAGLDVYAEKPVSLTVEEGRVLTRAARRYNRVVQAGTQQRSMPINIYASELVASGKIGKIKKVVVCNFLAPARWTPQPAQPMPDGLDWEAWVNQTEMRLYHTELHRGWAKWWDYDGGGQSWGVSGWGTHSLDQVQAALGTSLTGPVEFLLGENGVVTMRYENGTDVVLEQPIINDHQQLGGIFEGTNGQIQILRGDFKTNRPELKKGAPDVIVEGPGENKYHLANFFECVKTRKKPNADIAIAHRSTTVCHIINMCRDLKRNLKWDPEAEIFVGDAEANKLLSRTRRKGWELPGV